MNDMLERCDAYVSCCSHKNRQQRRIKSTAEVRREASVTSWLLQTAIRLYKHAQKNSDQIVQNISDLFHLCLEQIIHNIVALYGTHRVCLCASLNHLSELLIPINLYGIVGMTEPINEVVLTV